MCVCVGVFSSPPVEVKYRYLLHCNEFKTYSICLNFDYIDHEKYMYIYKGDLLNPPKSQKKITFLLESFIK